MKPESCKLISNNEPRTNQPPSLAHSPIPLLQPIKKPLKPNTPFDSSMALTILVLLTALFFMGFFSIYIRRCADHSSVDISRRRRHSSTPPTSSSSSRFTSALHPSTIRSLPVFSYAADTKHPIDCPVCLAEFEDTDSVKIIPFCKHVFHQPCIDKWLSSQVSCPVCRTTRLFPVEGGFDQDMSELERRSTADCGDTWTLGVRRTTSCSSLGERGLLQRTSSF